MGGRSVPADPNDPAGVPYDRLDIDWQYEYDPVGNRLTEADPNGHTTTYQYDTLNQLVFTTDPLGNATEYRYFPPGCCCWMALRLSLRMTNAYPAAKGNGSSISQWRFSPFSRIGASLGSVRTGESPATPFDRWTVSLTSWASPSCAGLRRGRLTPVRVESVSG